MLTTIAARITVPGLHHWPDAAGARAYLAAPHRHLFVIEAEYEVAHDDRDIEWHDLAQTMTEVVAAMADSTVGGLYDFGGRSCEALARELTGFLSDRWRRVSWSEDGEFTATITRTDDEDLNR